MLLLSRILSSRPRKACGSECIVSANSRRLPFFSSFPGLFIFPCAEWIKSLKYLIIGKTLFRVCSFPSVHSRQYRCIHAFLNILQHAVKKGVSHDSDRTLHTACAYDPLCPLCGCTLQPGMWQTGSGRAATFHLVCQRTDRGAASSAGKPLHYMHGALRTGLRTARRSTDP